jgi:tetratricopeptide (TPR) repeat protein
MEQSMNRRIKIYRKQYYIKNVIMLLMLILLALIHGCTSQDKDKAEKLNEKGGLYLIRGDYVKAIDSFEEAIKYCPECTEPYQNLSAIYFKLSSEQNEARAKEGLPPDYGFYKKGRDYSEKAMKLLEKKIAQEEEKIKVK